MSHHDPRTGTRPFTHWGSQGYYRIDDESAQRAPRGTERLRTATALASPYEPRPLNHDHEAVYIPLQSLTTFRQQDRPTSDPENQARRTRNKWRTSSLLWERQGWRAGAMSCAVGSTVVCIINLVVTIWATAEYDVEQGRSTLFNGSCDVMRPLNTFLHLLINTLSTVLLSSSNYCMQCLSAPTRAEVDRAHAKGVWLDIGVPSIRNLRYISPLRSTLWAILGFSSLPLHLFYNSAVYSSIAANDYPIYTISEALLNSKMVNSTLGLSDGPSKDELIHVVRSINNGSSSIERLGRDDCIKAYARNFVSSRATLLMVATGYDNATISKEVLQHCSVGVALDGIGEQFNWICDEQSPNTSLYCRTYWDEYLADTGRCRDRYSRIYTNPLGWKPFGYTIKECYSKKTTEHCKVQFSLILAIVVIVINALKASVMFYLALYTKENPLMTMGDSVASFLDTGDVFSKDMCLASRMDIDRSKDLWASGPRRFHLSHRRWFAAASTKRWITCVSMFVFALAVVCSLFEYGRRAILGPTDISSLAKLGMGEIQPATMITWPIPSSGAAGLLLNILLANAAQPILSFMYFAYNGLFTSMFLSQEWASYASKRKGLRVSTAPRGAQRGTYFLQLPYRIALPLMAVSGLLHWLISQSIFLVSVESYNDFEVFARESDGNYNSQTSCGYSPLAIIFVICMVGLLVTGLLAVGAKRFETGIPIAASCSLAIAAACHPGKSTNEKEDSTGKVKWGVIEHGHLGFSSGEVGVPVDGAMYQ